jgi:hypothetical protein
MDILMRRGLPKPLSGANRKSKSSAAWIRFAKECRMPHHAVLRSIKRAALGETRSEAAIKIGAAFSNESGGN